MSILSSMVGASFAPPGPVTGVANTWDTFTIPNALTGVTQYTGLNNATIAIHGVQNTDKLVMVFGVQNAARTTHSLYPAVFDLGTKIMAVGSAISVGNVHPPGNYYVDCPVAGEGNIGMVSTTTYVNNANWRNYARGYTISNWGSITTASLPTLTLSTARTKATDGSGHYVGYLGNNRFGISQRDAAAGDTNIMDVLTHNGSSAPTVFRAGTTAGGARSAGIVKGIRNGISATNFAAYYFMVGNNNNFQVPQYWQGNSANIRQYSHDGNLSSAGGNSFQGNLVNDVSGSVVTINQMNDGYGTPGASNRITASKWTNANSPTVNPSVTTTAAYQTNVGGPYNAFLPIGTKTSSAVYVPDYTDGTTTRFNILNVNTTTLAISKTTAQLAATPWSGDMYFEEFYNATYGQWIIGWAYSGGNITFYFNKWNP
jgi:hypothetical protein